ncbi:hypothetical protein RUM44_011066 [Polyplax serrata]|uniref:Phospholipase B1, membrane-associated n=1 Tax=Polyplax serrata TaxID=468196 RepID=A0ABR1ANY7_POLSC
MDCNGERKSAFQQVVPQNFPFPCPDRSLWRSKNPPTSVHRLRPGDIDVVAAIGDSLTAANGGLAENMLDVYFDENRGVSWSIGGQGTWRQFLTVPNLLKVMNPNLVGYSEGNGNTFSHNAQFNVAYSGAMDQDLMGQAIRLLRRMKRDRRVDFKNHWKMLTVMIGTNDICSDQCHDKTQGAETHRRNLMELLDFFYLNMPKTFVNLVVMPHIPYYAELINPPFRQCFPMQLMTCSCLFGGLSPKNKLARVIEMTKKFQHIQEEIVESGRYNNRDDFVVVYQPTNLNSHFPKLPLEKRSFKIDPHDYSYVAIDCIHYTQKLHARIANAYWNNLFEDPGNKTTDWETPAYSKFLCPTRRKPFLLTKKNFRMDFTKSH